MHQKHEATAKVAMYGLEKFPNDDMIQPYQAREHNTIL